MPVVNRDIAYMLLRALADAHPLSPRGVKEALERVKMMPAASGAPGTRVSFGNWTRRAWMGAGYLAARRLDADGVNSHLVDRFGDKKRSPESLGQHNFAHALEIRPRDVRRQPATQRRQVEHLAGTDSRNRFWHRDNDVRAGSPRSSSTVFTCEKPAVVSSPGFHAA